MVSFLHHFLVHCHGQYVLSFNSAATFLAFSLELLVAERVSSALVNAVDKLLAPVFSVPKPLVKLEPPFANCCETEEIC